MENTPQAWLKVLEVKQDGKPIQGEPKSGAHTLAVKNGMAFYGNRQRLTDLLSAAFTGCTFTWEGELPKS